MEHFAGLDVSVNETSVCIVDETGKIVREVKVASEPDALLTVLKNRAYHFKRIGLEAGPLSQWLYSALAEDDPGVIYEPCRGSSRLSGKQAAVRNTRHALRLPDQPLRSRRGSSQGSSHQKLFVMSPLSVHLVQSDLPNGAAGGVLA